VALSASVLSAAIKAQRLAGNPGAEIVNNAALTADCDAIAAAVVAHIQAAAVLVVAAGIPVATAGSPSAQTGATTAPGTGTIT
jgi:hypothetical protein